MKKVKPLLALILVFAIFFSIIPSFATQQGTVTASTLTVRSGPGTEYGAVGYVYQGDVVTILGSATATTGKIWYNISYNGGTGYASSSYITLLTDGTEEEFTGNFEEYLDYQRFPESYKPFLRELHELYPEWKFVAFHTNLDWNTVLANECVLERNLVVDNSTTPSSWKSTVSGAFDWVNNKYIVLNGSNFIQASEDAIKYHLDPRNFLNDENIFQFELLTYSNSQTIEGVNAILKNTFMYNTTIENGMTYAQAFVQIGKELNVSPYLLANRVRQEQGTAGNSALISGTYSGYVGYYNYFNVKATGSTATAVIVNGLAHAKSQGWNTRYKSLKGGAQVLAQTYILQGQDTLYLQKFDVESQYNGLYWHQYMQALYAAHSEGNTARKAYNNMGVLGQNFTFKIPVYLNMPEEICVKPTKDGNPNNKLSSLSVSGYSISPTFNRDTNSYSLSVGETVSSITVSAKTYASTTTISGTGTRSLQYGDNQIDVVAKAQNGDIRTYTINVYRDPGDNCISHTDADGMWETDGTNHWHTCTCGATFDVATHSDVNGTWETDDTNHWHTCTCGVTFDILPHSGGEGTCVALPVCEFCNSEYGLFDSSKHLLTDIINNKPATDLEEGYTGDTFCYDCETIIEHGSVISATGIYLELMDASTFILQDGIITNVRDMTTVSDFVADFNNSDKLFVVDSSDKILSDSSVITTGCTVYTLTGDGNILDSATVIVYGDVNGDGKISAADYMKIKRTIKDTSMLSGVYITAADVNKDGKIAAADYMMVKRHITGAFNIFV